MNSGRSIRFCSGLVSPVFLALLLSCIPMMTACELEVDSTDPHMCSEPHPESVGIGIALVNGQPEPIELVAGRRYHIESITLKANRWDAPTDDFLEWVQMDSAFSSLNWEGCNLAQTHWREAHLGEELANFTETRIYQDAAWMGSGHTFSVEVLDGIGNSLLEPITLSQKQFVTNVRGTVGWALEAPSRRDYGENQGIYDAWAISSAGRFTGPQDDIYAIEVTQEGPLDGTARVGVSSVQGDDFRGVLPVYDGVPVNLGSADFGATLTFDAPSTSAVLEVGDRWSVRCSASTGTVEAPVPATQAHYSGEAIVWSSVACNKAPEFVLPAGAAALAFGWTGTEGTVLIPLTLVQEGLPGPGFRMDIATQPPENGRYFEPGETIEGRLGLSDGNGHLLHPEDRLPTYREFIEGRSNGIAYTVPGEEECLAGFSDCFEDIMMVSFAGPTHRIEPHYGAEPPSVYYAVEETIPPMAIIYGGYGNRDLWDTPISRSFSFTLPASVLPGTYVIIVKASRVFQGERLNLMKEIDLQVGTEKPTEYDSGVGNCDLCHVRNARLDRLRHGTEDPRTCKICHVPPHSVPFPEMVHLIHFYSPAYPSPRNDCSHCHLEKESMLRNSVAVCGGCHGDDLMNNQYADSDPYAACGSVCHNTPPIGHLTGPE